MHRWSRLPELLTAAGITLFLFPSGLSAMHAQGSDPAALAEVRQAVSVELDANRTDKHAIRNERHSPADEPVGAPRSRLSA